MTQQDPTTSGTHLNEPKHTCGLNLGSALGSALELPQLRAAPRFVEGRRHHAGGAAGAGATEARSPAPASKTRRQTRKNRGSSFGASGLPLKTMFCSRSSRWLLLLLNVPSKQPMLFKIFKKGGSNKAPKQSTTKLWVTVSSDHIIVLHRSV